MESIIGTLFPLSRTNEMLSRTYEILSRTYEMLSRTYEILSRTYEIPISYAELSFVTLTIQQFCEGD